MPAFATAYPAEHGEHGEHAEEGHGPTPPSPMIEALADYVVALRPPPQPEPAPTPTPVEVPPEVPNPNVAIQDEPPPEGEEVVEAPEGEEATGEEGLEGEEVAEAPVVDTQEMERDHAAAFIRDRMFN
jgi:hypothetical protein